MGAKSSILKKKHYDELWSEVCEATFTPVLLWQPGELRSLPLTVSCRAKGGDEGRKMRIKIVTRRTKNKEKGVNNEMSNVTQVIGQGTKIHHVNST